MNRKSDANRVIKKTSVVVLVRLSGIPSCPVTSTCINPYTIKLLNIKVFES